MREVTRQAGAAWPDPAPSTGPRSPQGPGIWGGGYSGLSRARLRPLRGQTPRGRGETGQSPPRGRGETGQSPAGGPRPPPTHGDKAGWGGKRRHPLRPSPPRRRAPGRSSAVTGPDPASHPPSSTQPPSSSRLDPTTGTHTGRQTRSPHSADQEDGLREVDSAARDHTARKQPGSAPQNHGPGPTRPPTPPSRGADGKWAGRSRPGGPLVCS